MSPNETTTLTLPCPVCHSEVFKGDPVVRCNKCDVFQHVPCWQRKGQCSGSLDCKGKGEDVIIVRVPYPGPTEVDIARAVETRVKRLLADFKPTQDLSGTAQSADIDRAVQQIDGAVTRARSQLATDVRTHAVAIEAKIQSVHTAVRQIEQHALHAPRPLDRLALDKAMKVLEARLDDLAKQSAERVDKLLRAAHEEIATELQRTAAAVEAVRFDVTTARHPFPWESAGPDELVAAGDIENEQGEGR